MTRSKISNNQIISIWLIAAAVCLLAISFAHAGEREGGKRRHDGESKKPDTVSQSIDVKQSASVDSKSQSKSRARATAAAAGGIGTGGNAEAAGGSAQATGGNVTVSNGGSGSGLNGRMVPDVSTTAPLTSTSCRNGISAGGSGNGWGGLLGFFTEDEICELRLLWEQFRTAGMHEKADKLLDGMMLMRCEKLAADQRKHLGDLCPKQAPQESQSVAFSSAG